MRTMKARQDARPLVLIYANNRWEEITFREEIEALGDHLNLEVVHVLFDPPEGWQGESGFVSRDILERRNLWTASDDGCSGKNLA